MKKLICLFLIGTMSLSSIGCSKSNTSSTNDRSDSTTLTIGLDENFPPLGFKDDNGEITGFDVEIAKAVGEKIGVNFKFQPIDWSTKELELNSGKIDLIWNGLTITEDRLENMEFSKPYLENRQIIVVNNASISSKEDLAGRNIGLQKNSSAVDAVNSDPISSQLIINEYNDNVTAFTDLEIGRIDAVVADEILARYYLTNSNKNFSILSDDFGDELYGIAAKKGNSELINKITKGLDILDKEGKITQISEKWFGEDIYYRN